jgi:CHASE3 domain sensor protein
MIVPPRKRDTIESILDELKEVRSDNPQALERIEQMRKAHISAKKKNGGKR